MWGRHRKHEPSEKELRKTREKISLKHIKYNLGHKTMMIPSAQLTEPFISISSDEPYIVFTDFLVIYSFHLDVNSYLFLKLVTIS